MEYIAIFFTHSGAIKYNRFLRESGIKSDTLPVPRKLSSNCGIGVRFTYDGDLGAIITEDIEKLFSMKDSIYYLEYECN